MDIDTTALEGGNMETYKTFSLSGELNGWMEVSNGVVDTYYSETFQENGTIDRRYNLVTEFKVTFSKGSGEYHIKCLEFGDGTVYVGAAKNGRILAEEPWAATASTFVMFEKDAATKAAS